VFHDKLGLVQFFRGFLFSAEVVYNVYCDSVFKFVSAFVLQFGIFGFWADVMLTKRIAFSLLLPKPLNSLPLLVILYIDS
jgi:hypothetical protein